MYVHFHKETLEIIFCFIAKETHFETSGAHVFPNRVKRWLYNLKCFVHWFQNNEVLQKKMEFIYKIVLFSKHGIKIKHSWNIKMRWIVWSMWLHAISTLFISSTFFIRNIFKHPEDVYKTQVWKWSKAISGLILGCTPFHDSCSSSSSRTFILATVKGSKLLAWKPLYYLLCQFMILLGREEIAIIELELISHHFHMGLWKPFLNKKACCQWDLNQGSLAWESSALTNQPSWHVTKLTSK